jgi:hypothetical protein
MHSALENYYQEQAGSGQTGDGIPVFKGRPWHQSGGSFFGLIKRIGIPLLKYLGRTAAQGAVGIGTDMLAGQDFKEAAKERLKETGRKVGNDAVARAQTFLQKGRGYKKKQKSKSRSVARRTLKRADIFDG